MCECKKNDKYQVCMIHDWNVSQLQMIALEGSRSGDFKISENVCKVWSYLDEVQSKILKYGVILMRSNKKI